MIDVSKGILNTVSFFQTAFTIVIALAIGEAFKQFIADKADKPEHRPIHWDRLPALLSFLLLAFPFFHGMSRYFFVAYTNATQVPKTYGGYLIVDGIAFIAMSALLFVMARTLSRHPMAALFLFSNFLARGGFHLDSICSRYPWIPRRALVGAECRPRRSALFIASLYSTLILFCFALAFNCVCRNYRNHNIK